MTPARRTGRTVPERAPTSLDPPPVVPMPADPPSPSRGSLRMRFRGLRRSLDAERRTRAERAITHAVLELDAFARARRVALYRAFDGEVDLAPLERVARAAGKNVVFARVAARGQALVFVEPHRWQVRSSGLSVPSGPTVALEAGDLLIVPGVAFDLAGNRLGLGGGYYDRTLSVTPAVPVGVCFECQRTESLPRAPWDRPLPTLVTERGVFDFDIEESRD